ncbi:MAG: dihydrodipicolinate synthase family protein, partial [Clostridia bacterium]|nr:dihydrodipicolinate synthase family protein [Clostridia bacterium]
KTLSELFHKALGDDSLTVPIISMGGTGVISVVSNIFPAYIGEMTNSALAGDFKTASKMQLDILPLVKMMFSEVNPIPVKKASEIIGLTNGILRLPLTEMSEENSQKLETLISQFKRLEQQYLM